MRYTSLIKKLITIIVKPINCQPAFFILVYVLLNALDIYALLINGYTPLFKSISGIFLCYLLLLPTVTLRDTYNNIYKLAVMIFSIILFSVDLYLLLIYNETFYTFGSDVVGVVMATNPMEIKEFVATYFAIDKLSILLLSVSVLIIIYQYLKSWSLKSGIVSNCILFVFILSSSVYSLVSVNRLAETNYLRLFTVHSPDLREFKQDPTVKYYEERPDEIVLILGESVSKEHCSVYGYEKQTTPFFEKMKNEGLLCVYDSVITAGLSTIPAIKALLMAYTDEMVDSIDWVKCLTLIEVMQKANYRTYWLSNQTKSGLLTNEIGCFSDLCDEQQFVDGKDVFAWEKENSDKYFDGRLIGLFDEYLYDNFQNKFLLVHVMGSHFVYKNRYPKEFTRFNNEDYALSHPHLSIENRETISQYDNSILYGDSVVYEVFNKFKDRDAVVIYLSDHGQDVYDSSDNYAGHARIGDVKSEEACLKIPLMVYTTSLFREKHPQLQQRIENAVNTPYRTDSIMYTIMDIAGIETVNGVSYKHKSLFK